MTRYVRRTLQHKPPCLAQQKLITAVQDHLMQVCKLTRAIAEAMTNGNENFYAQIG